MNDGIQLYNKNSLCFFYIIVLLLSVEIIYRYFNKYIDLVILNAKNIK